MENSGQRINGTPKSGKRSDRQKGLTRGDIARAVTAVTRRNEGPVSALSAAEVHALRVPDVGLIAGKPQDASSSSPRVAWAVHEALDTTQGVNANTSVGMQEHLRDAKDIATNSKVSHSVAQGEKEDPIIQKLQREAGLTKEQAENLALEAQRKPTVRLLLERLAFESGASDAARTTLRALATELSKDGSIGGGVNVESAQFVKKLTQEDGGVITVPEVVQTLGQMERAKASGSEVVVDSAAGNLLTEMPGKLDLDPEQVRNGIPLIPKALFGKNAPANINDGRKGPPEVDFSEIAGRIVAAETRNNLWGSGWNAQQKAQVQNTQSNLLAA